jgi:hypothetical protein
MQLLDAIFLAAQVPDGSVICARAPFHQTSEAVTVQLKEDGSVPQHAEVEDYAYFLETSGLKELLEMAGKKRSSRETKVELVCYYASWDAYPAWYFDLEDAQRDPGRAA